MLARLIIVWQLNERFAEISPDIRTRGSIKGSMLPACGRSAELSQLAGVETAGVCFLSRESLPVVSHVPCNFPCVSLISVLSVAGRLQMKPFNKRAGQRFRFGSIAHER